MCIRDSSRCARMLCSVPSSHGMNLVDTYGRVGGGRWDPAPFTRGGPSSGVPREGVQMVKNISSAAPKFTRFTPLFPGIVLRVVDNGGRCRLSSGALGIDVVMPFVDESSSFVRWPESVPSLRALCIRLLLTCLLYTSPSPRDLSTSRMPSSA